MVAKGVLTFYNDNILIWNHNDDRLTFLVCGLM